jgi:hypothetical protein
MTWRARARSLRRRGSGSPASPARGPGSCEEAAVRSADESGCRSGWCRWRSCCRVVRIRGRRGAAVAARSRSCGPRLPDHRSAGSRELSACDLLGADSRSRKPIINPPNGTPSGLRLLLDRRLAETAARAAVAPRSRAGRGSSADGLHGRRHRQPIGRALGPSRCGMAFAASAGSFAPMCSAAGATSGVDAARVRAARAARRLDGDRDGRADLRGELPHPPHTRAGAPARRPGGARRTDRHARTGEAAADLPGLLGAHSPSGRPAGAEGLEPPTPGFGDRCSTS